jgi:hypothetical protein
MYVLCTIVECFFAKFVSFAYFNDFLNGLFHKLVK